MIIFFSSTAMLSRGLQERHREVSGFVQCVGQMKTPITPTILELVATERTDLKQAWERQTQAHLLQIPTHNVQNSSLYRVQLKWNVFI